MKVEGVVPIVMTATTNAVVMTGECVGRKYFTYQTLIYPLWGGGYNVWRNMKYTVWQEQKYIDEVYESCITVSQDLY